MFKENKEHLQSDMFSFTEQLDDRMKKKLHSTEEYLFYELIFCKIKEDDFSVLYSNKASRPNAPINVLVGSLILMQKYTWSYEELFNQIYFNLLIRSALGLFTLNTVPFSMATIFNFQNRLLDHFNKTGEDLLNKVFDNLSQSQLKSLNIKTDIQRTDSFLADSNIRNYSRLQLLIELIIRFHRILSDADKIEFSLQFKDYINQSSGQYIYHLKGSDITHEYSKLANLYHFIYRQFSDKYGDKSIFSVLKRVFYEHFTFVDEKIELIPTKELGSNIIQSPDDLDATYRKKRNTESRGYSINITETANPENQLNLLTDVYVEKNNVDDSTILNDRLDKIHSKTPDLNELHTDGGYGSEKNDKKMLDMGITQIQTAVRGRIAKLSFDIKLNIDGSYNVSCDNQSVVAKEAKKRLKASFDLSICENCPFVPDCPAKKMKKYRIYYFTKADYLQKKRQSNFKNIPDDRKRLRPNVEASVREFKRRMPEKKLKVRGLFKTMIFAYTTAIAINFGRICKYVHKISDDGDLMQFLGKYFVFFLKFVKIFVFDPRFLFNNNSFYLRYHYLR